MTELEHIVVVEVAVAAPAARVWRALRDPAELRRWFGWEYEDLEKEIDTIFLSGASASEDDLAIGWEGGDSIRLEDRGESTAVRYVRPVLAPGEARDPMADEIDAGWTMFLQQLRLALERHPGQARRTLWLSGRPRTGDAGPAARALGLEAAVARAPGERYEAVTAVGEPLSGELWFTAPGLSGLTVDAYGEGLLILGDQPAQSAPPHGRATALLTAYGLDDAAFAAVRERWIGWWEGRFDEPSSAAGP